MYQTEIEKLSSIFFISSFQLFCLPFKFSIYSLFFPLFFNIKEEGKTRRKERKEGGA